MTQDQYHGYSNLSRESHHLAMRLEDRDQAAGQAGPWGWGEPISDVELAELQAQEPIDVAAIGAEYRLRVAEMCRASENIISPTLEVAP